LPSKRGSLSLDAPILITNILSDKSKEKMADPSQGSVVVAARHVVGSCDWSQLGSGSYRPPALAISKSKIPPRPGVKKSIEDDATPGWPTNQVIGNKAGIDAQGLCSWSATSHRPFLRQTLHRQKQNQNALARS
jgi:hypothetical protein